MVLPLLGAWCPAPPQMERDTRADASRCGEPVPRPQQAEVAHEPAGPRPLIRTRWMAAQLGSQPNHTLLVAARVCPAPAHGERAVAPGPRGGGCRAPTWTESIQVSPVAPAALGSGGPCQEERPAAWRARTCWFTPVAHVTGRVAAGHRAARWSKLRRHTETSKQEPCQL